MNIFNFFVHTNNIGKTFPSPLHSEIKSVVALKDQFDAAVHDLRAKLGNDWTLDVDWVSFANNSKGFAACDVVCD